MECGEEGICKCRRMRGRDYYEDYLLMECRDYIKFYSHGRREFSYGTVLHFTGAPEDLSREDLYIALLELGIPFYLLVHFNISSTLSNLHFYEKNVLKLLDFLCYFFIISFKN